MIPRPLKRDLSATERLHSHVRKALADSPDFVVKDALALADSIHQDGAGSMNSALEAAISLGLGVREIATGDRVVTPSGMAGVVTAIVRVHGAATAQITLDRDALVNSKSSRFYNRPVKTRFATCALADLLPEHPRGSP